MFYEHILKVQNQGENIYITYFEGVSKEEKSVQRHNEKI